MNINQPLHIKKMSDSVQLVIALDFQDFENLILKVQNLL